MLRLIRSIGTSLVLVQILLVAKPALAEDPAAAEALFQEGRRLMADGQVSAACEKFKESFALDAMSGTLLNLAACYEKDGRTATAWARFRNAASLAKSQGKADQAAEANRRVKALEAELSYLTIFVNDPVPGLEVKRNDQEVTPSLFGSEVPVDPGRTEIIASAPGYRTQRITVEIGARRDKQTVKLRKLEPVDESTAAEPEPRGEVATASTIPEVKPQTTRAVEQKPSSDNAGAAVTLNPKPEKLEPGPGKWPWIVGGVGAATAVVGGVFGFLALESNRNANDLCPTRNHCSKRALDAADRRDQQALFADIGIGVGLAAVVTSAVWILTSKPSHSDDIAHRITVQPAVAKDAATLWAVGSF